MSIQVKFLGYDCAIQFSHYPKKYGGRIAIELMDSMSGERIAVATTNLPDEPLGEDCVFIKDWSENAGVLKALVDAKVLMYTGMKVTTGFCQAHLCRLLIKPEF